MSGIPNWVRCRHTAKVPYAFTSEDGITVHPSIRAVRYVRCGWPRWHQGLKHKCRFNDPGRSPSYMLTGEQLAARVMLVLTTLFFVITLILGLLGEMR